MFWALLEIIRQNPGSCRDLLCYNTGMKMTAEKFFSQMMLKEPDDFSEKQSYLWFLKYVQSASEEQLIRLLQFVSGYKSIPPRGLLHKICVKYLPDDESATLPKSMACLNLVPRLFLRGRKDPGRSWSRATQNLGGKLKKHLGRGGRVLRLENYNLCA